MYVVLMTVWADVTEEPATWSSPKLIFWVQYARWAVCHKKNVFSYMNFMESTSARDVLCRASRLPKNWRMAAGIDPAIIEVTGVN